MENEIKACGVVALGAALFIGLAIYSRQPACAKSHKERRHRAAYFQFIQHGKTRIPIYHAAADYEVDVCDEYAPSARP